MDCIFCRGDKAIELNPKLPLCGPCAEMKDFMREWAATKEQHGLGPAEYGLRIWQAAQESQTAAVH